MTLSKKKRIDKETTRTARALALLHKLRDSQRRVHLSDLKDGAFGCDKTVGRLIGDLNGSWDIFRGGPLIKLEKVEHDGKRDKALILIDEIPEVNSAKSLIHLPVLKNFLSNLKGTTVADQIEERLSRSINALSAKGQSTLRSLDQKFIHVSKGEVQYNLIFEILDSVIDALVREKVLKVQVQREDGLKTYNLKPLALLWMKSNLYLAAFKEGEPESKEPYTWAVEGFVDAKVLAESFIYPMGLELAKQFEAPYGLL
ncbi:MAG: WYL domain-containing protein, partial [Proteobacteria bacterium]